MSIAEWQKVLKYMAKVDEQAAELAQLRARVAQLEAKRGPGRPPKEAQAA